MLRRWTPSEDVAVRLADALDAEDGGRRLLELARRLGRTEAAVPASHNRIFRVRRDKALFLSGCESRPATVAPAGSSRERTMEVTTSAEALR